jgi:hypothetical protein
MKPGHQALRCVRLRSAGRRSCSPSNRGHDAAAALRRSPGAPGRSPRSRPHRGKRNTSNPARCPDRQTHPRAEPRRRPQHGDRNHPPRLVHSARCEHAGSLSKWLAAQRLSRRTRTTIRAPRLVSGSPAQTVISSGCRNLPVLLGILRRRHVAAVTADARCACSASALVRRGWMRLGTETTGKLISPRGCRVVGGRLASPCVTRRAHTRVGDRPRRTRRRPHPKNATMREGRQRLGPHPAVTAATAATRFR